MGAGASGLLSFIGIVTLLVMFPGPNTVLVLQSVGLRGKKAGFYNIAGIISALYVHAVIFAWGLSLLIVKSLAVYHLIKYIGAVYIIYLGLASLYSAYRMKEADFPAGGAFPPHSAAPHEAAGDGGSVGPLPGEAAWQSYAKGLITNIFNPKVALFFVSFFPQFLRNQDPIFGQSLFLVMIYSVIASLWYAALVCFVAKLRHWLNRRIVQRRMKAFTGILLVGLGVKIAAQK